VVWTDLATWQRIVDQPEMASVIVVRGTGSPDPYPGTVVTTADDSLSAIAGFSQEQGSLQLMQGFLMVISALVVGAFFTVWIIQRRRDIAVLKAMGASTPYLLGDAIGQAAIVLVAASVVGGGAGFLVGMLIGDAVPFLSTLETIVYPLVLMSALGLIGAGLAIRTITKVDPLIALGASR
jgi:putative ABC transport system permease protein